MRTEAWLWLARGTGLALGALAVLVLAMLLTTASNVVVLVAISILIAAGLQPVVGWVRARLRLQRVLSILLVYAIFFAVAIVLAVLVVPAAVAQIEELGRRMPELLASLRAWAAGLQPAVVGDTLTGVIDSLGQALPAAVDEPDPDVLVAAGLAAADIAISIMTVLALVFFWLTGRGRLQRFILALLPEGHRRGVREGWNDVETRLGLWIRAEAILVATIFLLTTPAYFLLGLPSALALGLIAGLAEIIPIVGPALGAIPALIVAIVTTDIETTVLVALVYVAIQVFEGNVLVPIVMRNAVGVPPFLVIVSLLVGSAVAGIVGAVLAIPAAAAIVVVLQHAQARTVSISLETPRLGDEDGKDTDEDDEEEAREDRTGAPSVRPRDAPRAGEAGQGGWTSTRGDMGP
jgi:predicted PurR-regulated permease PerM